MDERRILDALRAGPPDEQPHRQGAFARGIAARDAGPRDESTFRVTLRPQSSQRPTLLLVAALAIVVLSIAIAVVGTSPAPTPTQTPTPAPTLGTPAPAPSAPSSSAPSVGEGAPVQLVDRWVGSVRTIPGLEHAATRAILDIQGTGFRFDAGSDQPRTIFASSVRPAGANVLRFTSLSPNIGCRPFDEGTYGWSLSSEGTELTLTPIDDACAERPVALEGTWTHTACRDAAQDCLGSLEAGMQRSMDFDALGTGTAGQLTYTVPSGWANSSDHRLNYALRPAGDYAADPGFDGNDTVGGVYLWAGSLAADQPPECSAVPATDVAATADAIAAHVADLDGLDVVDGGSIVIGGRDARVLDVSLDPTYTTGCPWSGGGAFRSLIMFADAGADGGVQGIATGERSRILFLDVAPGRVVSIWIDGPADRFDALINDAMPIVESMEFEGLTKSP